MGSKRTCLRSTCLAMFVTLFGAINADACSPVPGLVERKPEELYSQADAIVAAHLTKTEEVSVAGEDNIIVIEGTFRTIEVLKGEYPDDGKVLIQMREPLNCGSPLISGLYYIFYLNNKGKHISMHDGSVVPLGSVSPFLVDAHAQYSAQDKKGLMQIIEDYVVANKGWERGRFYIKVDRYSGEGGFSVIKKNKPMIGIGGDENSFLIKVDLKTRKIIGTYAYQ